MCILGDGDGEVLDFLYVNMYVFAVQHTHYEFCTEVVRIHTCDTFDSWLYVICTIIALILSFSRTV